MISPGGPLNVDEREIPFSIAAASVNGLKALPAWRWPCEARLNWRRSPLGTSTAIARIFERVVDGRRLRQAGEERRLRQAELARAPGEVRLRGGLDPVGVVAVVDLVQVRREDAVPRPGGREPEREAGLPQLALERALVVPDVEVPDELLRDRRAALGEGALLEVGDSRSQDALVVETTVLVEALILDRDGRLRDPVRHLAELQRLPVARGGDRAEQRAVGGEDERVLADPQRAESVEGARRLDGLGAAERGRDDAPADDDERQDEQREREAVRQPVRLLAPPQAPAADARRQVVVARRRRPPAVPAVAVRRPEPVSARAVRRDDGRRRRLRAAAAGRAPAPAEVRIRGAPLLVREDPAAPALALGARKRPAEPDVQGAR